MLVRFGSLTFMGWTSVPRIREYKNKHGYAEIVRGKNQSRLCLFVAELTDVTFITETQSFDPRAWVRARIGGLESVHSCALISHFVLNQVKLQAPPSRLTNRMTAAMYTHFISFFPNPTKGNQLDYCHQRHANNQYAPKTINART